MPCGWSASVPGRDKNKKLKKPLSRKTLSNFLAGSPVVCLDRLKKPADRKTLMLGCCWKAAQKWAAFLIAERNLGALPPTLAQMPMKG